MGAQTRQSLVAARSFLVGSAATSRELAMNLFAAALGLSSSPALRGALCDAVAEPVAKGALASKAFASLSADAKKLIGQLVSLRWSRPEDLQGALEDLGIRGLAGSAGQSTDLVGELLAISSVIHSDSELELTLGSKRVPAPHKTRLLSALLGTKVSVEALAIANHLVSDPRGRRSGAMLLFAAETVADHHGKGLAVVTVAKPLSSAQKSHVEGLLRQHYGKDHYLAEVHNPDVIGGLKIRVGNDVIDGSIQTRLQDLRTQLAS
jgi:F-type H+-transporting ATPase subunit delta